MKKFVLFLLMSFVMSGMVQAQEEWPVSFKPAPEPDGEIESGGGCQCAYPDRAVVFQVTWIIATCKSHCTRGIGFRCGSEGWLICASGKMVSCYKGERCPHMVATEHRSMTGALNFYEDGTVKITFQNPLPREEQGQTDFEVEDPVQIRLPEGMLIGDQTYKVMMLAAGTYKINYENERYGSVRMPVTLIN